MRILLLFIIPVFFTFCGSKDSNNTQGETTETEALSNADNQTSQQFQFPNQNVSDDSKFTMTLNTDEIAPGTVRRFSGEKSVVLIHEGKLIYNGKSYQSGQHVILNDGEYFITDNSGASISRWDLYATAENYTPYVSAFDIELPDGIEKKRGFSISSTLVSTVGISDGISGKLIKLEKYDLPKSTVINNIDNTGTSISLLQSGHVNVIGRNSEKMRNEYGESWTYDSNPSHLSARERSIFHTVYIANSNLKGTPVPISALANKGGAQTLLAEATL